MRPILNGIAMTEPTNLGDMLNDGGATWQALLFLLAAQGMVCSIALAVAIARDCVERGCSGGDPPGVGDRRLLGRPACGSDPMFWKELHVERLTGIVRVGCVLAGLLLIFVVFEGCAEQTFHAVRELWTYGYGDGEIVGP